MKALLSLLIVTTLISLKAHSKTIKIAIIDTGINIVNNSDIKICDKGILDASGAGSQDRVGHGTNISYIIADRLKGLDYCLYIIKYYDPLTTNFQRYKSFIVALKVAYMLNPDIINISAGGDGFFLEEKSVVTNILKKNIMIVAAAGNNSWNLDKSCNYYPACYSTKITMVGNLTSGGKVADKTSNYGKRVSVWEIGDNVCAANICMTGTSQATAKRTAGVARKLIGR